MLAARQMTLKGVLLETRPNFLVLPLVLVFLGTSVASYYGAFRPGYALLATLGLVLAHASVNVLNNYWDYRTGIDLVTRRTPFSGGSGVLPARLLQPWHSLWLGVGAFFLAVPIGIYFVVVSGWPLLPLLLLGAVCVLFYSPHIYRTPWPEWSPGLGLGLLPVLGAYFVQSGSYTLSAVAAAVPSGILVHNLLLLNEFPDVEADRRGGRKTLPLALGMPRAGVVYSALTIAMYAWIVGCAIAGVMPLFTLVALATLPLAMKAIQGALNPTDEAKLMSALGPNVLVVLLTQLLIGVGYVLAAIF